MQKYFAKVSMEIVVCSCNRAYEELRGLFSNNEEFLEVVSYDESYQKRTGKSGGRIAHN